eukprot:INCI15067.8.p1 GENE.INCI15067.8~~INCI15067.8.p1  ORF type:complete len:316 (-),score=68.44 INCI15067.8:736-1683(-)
MSNAPNRKRKISRCTGAQATPQPAPSSASGVDVDVGLLVKRLRKLEQENAHLRARVASSESNVHIMAEHLASRATREQQQQQQQQRQQRQEQQQQRQQQQQQRPRRPSSIQLPTSSPESQVIDKAQRPRVVEPVSPRLVPDGELDAQAAGAAAAAASAVARGERGASRQRIHSPRQFYLTLLAMYCSAFAHVMHGPNSERPILSRAEAQYEAERLQHQKFPTTAAKHISAAAQCHGIASAEADMSMGMGAAQRAGQKYERMLRASSTGLLRLIQFRRKIVRDRERNRRAAMMGSAPSKLASGQATYDSDRGPDWQ